VLGRDLLPLEEGIRRVAAQKFGKIC
jgi:hypothetical protein